LPNNQTVSFYDYSGGLNEVGQNVHLQQNETPYCKNVIFDELGSLVKRKGYQSIVNTPISTTEEVDGLYVFHEKDGSRHMIAVVAGTLYEVNEDTGNYTVINYSDGVTPVDDLTDTDYIGFTTWGNRCYITNGVEPVMEYDGSTVTKWGVSEQRGRYITAHKNMIFWAGDSSNPSAVYYSEIAPAAGSPGAWGEINVQTDDGDQIMNIIKLQDNLVIFKSNSIHVLYGSNEDQFALREVQTSVGTIAPKSVSNIMNRLFFLYRDGVYTFDGTNVQYISDKVRPTMNNIADPGKCAGGWKNHKYYLSYSDGIAGSDIDKCMVYDILHESWTRFTNYPVNMFNNYDGSQDGQININELYFGSAEQGEIYKVDEGYSDNGEDIEVEYRTKHFNLDALEVIKTFRRIMVDNLTIGNFIMIYDVDKGKKRGQFSISGLEAKDEYLWDNNEWSDATADDNDLVWAPDDKATIFASPLGRNVFGRNIRFIITEKSTDPMKLFGINLDFRPRRKRYRR